MKSSEILNSTVSHNRAPYRQIATAGKPQKARPLILVLGADADTRLLYKSFLEIWDYHVTEAGGIEEMLTITEYFQPKLILMDCSLSLESNLETVQTIRSNLFLRNTPLVLVSGYAQPQVRSLALKSGADDFLVKPLNFDDLRISLQEYVETPAQNKRQREVL